MAYTFHRDFEMVRNVQFFPECPRVEMRLGSLGPIIYSILLQKSSASSDRNDSEEDDSDYECEARMSSSLGAA